MPQASAYYTDLEIPTVNEDNTTYGDILLTYFQGLETKLKNLSDRVNAAGVGSSSTLAQINRDIAQVNTNTSGILPDPYSGNYSTVSTWPAYNTELTALGISPPETASEIETFFSSGDATILFNYLTGKLDALDIIVTQAETDLSSALQDTCATKTILDARLAAQSSGERTAVLVDGGSIGNYQLITKFTSVPTSIGGNIDESQHKPAYTSEYPLLQYWIDNGVLTTSFQSFYGLQTGSDIASGESVGSYVSKFGGALSGENRASGKVVEAKYTGASTVDSTTRIVLRMPQVINRENFFNRVVDDIGILRWEKYEVRYPYPALNCSNPSPPYFS